MAGFQIRAESKRIAGSPIKARRVVNAVRGMAPRGAGSFAVMPQARPNPWPRHQSAIATRKRTSACPRKTWSSEIAQSGPSRPWRRFGARVVSSQLQATSTLKLVLEEVEESRRSVLGRKYILGFRLGIIRTIRRVGTLKRAYSELLPRTCLRDLVFRETSAERLFGKISSAYRPQACRCHLDSQAGHIIGEAPSSTLRRQLED